VTHSSDPRRQLFNDDLPPAVEKSETLTLINKRGDRVFVLPWQQYGGISITNEQALVVFSYWLVTIKGAGLHELRKMFEERTRKELAASKRADKFVSRNRLQIDEIAVECLVRSRG
jgi:hypothetical protein